MIKMLSSAVPSLQDMSLLVKKTLKMVGKAFYFYEVLF